MILNINVGIQSITYGNKDDHLITLNFSMRCGIRCEPLKTQLSQESYYSVIDPMWHETAFVQVVHHDRAYLLSVKLEITYNDNNDDDSEKMIWNLVRFLLFLQFF